MAYLSVISTDLCGGIACVSSGGGGDGGGISSSGSSSTSCCSVGTGSRRTYRLLIIICRHMYVTIASRRIASVAFAITSFYLRFLSVQCNA